MLQPFPVEDPTFKDDEAELLMQSIKGVIEALRNFRGENGISPKVEFPVRFVPSSPSAMVFMRTYEPELRALCRVSSFTAISKDEKRSEGIEAALTVTSPPLEFRIDLQGLVNVEEEEKRLKKETERLKADVEFVRAKLAKPTFIEKAPPALVAKEKAREQELLTQLTGVESALARLQKLAPRR
jgi:valyl-tRNA synthetase